MVTIVWRETKKGFAFFCLIALFPNARRGGFASAPGLLSEGGLPWAFTLEKGIGWLKNARPGLSSAGAPAGHGHDGFGGRQKKALPFFA
jgi:hypothetical protein